MTNKQKFYGAGAFCIKSIVHDVMEFMKCDLFIFPSSKHELLIVPAKQCGIDTRELTQMVHQINQDTLEPADRLSDNIYHLCYETGILSTFYYTKWGENAYEQIHRRFNTNQDILKESMSTIQKTADQIITGVNQYFENNNTKWYRIDKTDIL